MPFVALDTMAGINWFGGDKHELRIKAQMEVHSHNSKSRFRRCLWKP